MVPKPVPAGGGEAAGWGAGEFIPGGSNSIGPITDEGDDLGHSRNGKVTDRVGARDVEMRGQSFQRGLRGKWTTAGRAGGHTLSSSLRPKSNGETSKASWKGVIQPNLHFTNVAS